MTDILIIDGHPDPDPARLGHALADAYEEAARGAGHSVDRIDLAGLDFPLLRSRHEWAEEPPVPAIAAAQQAITKAQHLAIFYPLWLGEMPALLKGFFEQVARPNFAIGEGKMPVPLLKGRSARVVITMGMPAAFYRFFYRAHSLRSLERNILKFSGIKPVRSTLIGMVEGAAPKQAEQWLEQMGELGRGAR
ncbi:dehydrogenase [Erythrobacter sp. SG61-1L]|uniref:NAD(P)H-dependent oxidoreductase n=1 Tax=Erythrobacter sp. SG61-1L TaxID=1603897 RepID=UPI0006C937CD|nr:NAD(P)H-dependent oxidoreductase [Erythrobacter sp. SG61-1L]KPL68802.1 dehydrogenase [Erythrobacter sp. SG61-1L]